MAALVVTAGVALVLAFPGRLLAKDGPPGPDGLPVASAKNPWKFMAGDPRVETFSFPVRDVVPAACREFEDDHWTILVGDPARGLVVTKWKQIHHPLVWLFAGKMMARVTVEMRSLGPGHTRVVFHGDLASHRALKGNPILPAARRAYAKAFSNWRRNVLRDLASNRRAPEPRRGAGQPRK